MDTSSKAHTQLSKIHIILKKFYLCKDFQIASLLLSELTHTQTKFVSHSEAQTLQSK